MESEFDSAIPVRFLDTKNIKMYDSQGNVVLCKCGKEAGTAAIGKNAMAAWCEDCTPVNKSEAKFVYNPPKQ